ncbi:MAG: hypothetical protein OHK0038_05340 [Flammeovirgaceae bacterium]
MKNVLKYYFGLVFLFLVITSCDDDDPEAYNDQELITKLVLTLEKNGVVVETATFSDKDGIGGTAPTIEGLTLEANTTYAAKITIFDESKTPIIDITEEIEKEKEEHQFFFTPSIDLKLTTSYKDKDSNNQPVGLEVEIKTTEVSSGTLKVVLKHEPIKSSTNAINTGETDIEVDFPVSIL